MAFNVNQFKGFLNQGVARAYHYELDVGDRAISFRAVNVSAPGRAVATAHTGVFGPLQEAVHSSIFTPITAQIILSPSHDERSFFTEWQDRAVPGVNGDGSFSIGYYNDYADYRLVQIKQYSEDGKLTKTIKLREAYPRSIGEISYSYMASEYATFAVTFQYRFYTEQ